MMISLWPQQDVLKSQRQEDHVIGVITLSWSVVAHYGLLSKSHSGKLWHSNMCEILISDHLTV